MAISVPNANTSCTLNRGYHRQTAQLRNLFEGSAKGLRSFTALALVPSSILPEIIKLQVQHDSTIQLLKQLASTDFTLWPYLSFNGISGFCLYTISIISYWQHVLVMNLFQICSQEPRISNVAIFFGWCPLQTSCQSDIKHMFYAFASALR
jgi:hypothetical protein